MPSQVIKASRCGETERLYMRLPSRRFGTIQRVALRQLHQLDAAAELRDLAAPPGNRLEALHGGREGQHSIRINDQWRILLRLAGRKCLRRGDPRLPLMGTEGLTEGRTTCPRR